jgi:hypothetical protein
MNKPYIFPIKTHEILDRYELLYPENESVADLRRAYIDQDLSSVFRLIGFSTVNGNADDLRKAVMEKNLHSIFRLVENDDLRKLILEDNTWKLWPLLSLYTNTQFTGALKSLFVNNVKFDPDCFSRGQLSSKQWVLKELEKINRPLGTVFLCAGWYGVLATMLFESKTLNVKAVRSFDIDDDCVEIAETFNKQWFINDWRFKALTMNIMDIDYNTLTWQYWSNKHVRMSYPIIDNPDTIINTSCEHITEFDRWYNMLPKKKLLVLQANDYNDLDIHTNCYKDLKDFADHTPMKQVLYSGVLQLEKYNRFMRIGFK